MNITFFFANHHPKLKQQNINEENNMYYKTVDACSA